MDTTTETQEKAQAVKDRLLGNLHEIVSEGEALLRSAQHNGSEQFIAARDKFESRLRHARDELADLQNSAAYKVRRAARAADTSVHEHPYATAGLVAGIGVLLGLLIARR